MANITERVNKSGNVSYLIRVFVDEDRTGKQKAKSMTWKPKPNMTPKQIEKELMRQATLFEEKVKSGLVSFDGSIRFEDYAEQYMKNAQISFATREQHNYLLKRINQAIGHLRLDRIQAHHLEEFYKNLKESGVRKCNGYATSTGLDDFMKKRKLSGEKLAKMAGLCPSTIATARRGQRIGLNTAVKIASALNANPETIFTINQEETGLSDKTVLHHHRLISTILGKAKRERIIPFNVAAEHAVSPKVTHREVRYLSDTDAKEMALLLFKEEDIRIKTALLLFLYSGMRRGELCGLNWSDIDSSKGVIHVLRASQYQDGKGVVEVPTKNKSSMRTIDFPPIVFELLNDYRKWWIQQKFNCGSLWQGKDRLFIQANGKPINPLTINKWLKSFIEKNNLPDISPHGLRHTFATLQIAGGVDIRTLQARTGHAQASTLVDIYSHAIKSAQEAAANIVDDMLTPESLKKNHRAG